MTKTTSPGTLCAVQDHPELADLDEAGIRLWAEAHDLDLHRDWRGLLCTDLEDAYKLRGILDAEHQRKAEADNARRAQLDAEDEIRLGHIRRRVEAQAHRAALHAAVDAAPLGIPFEDERRRDWEAKVDELGQALFAKVAPPPELDTRTPIERIKAKRGDK